MLVGFCSRGVCRRPAFPELREIPYSFLCGEISEIDWLDHKPALMSPERVTLEWNEIPAEKVPAVLQTHMPVCWDCHIAETFRRRYPGLVVDRSWKPKESHRSS